MAGLYVSCSILSVFLLTMLCNIYLLRYNLYIISAGVVIGLVSDILDVVPASIILVLSGLLVDALNFMPHFGGSAILYLLLYGLYRYVLENNKNLVENFSEIMLQGTNLIFIFYFATTKMTGSRASQLFTTIVLSQIIVQMISRIYTSATKQMIKKKEKNPFNIAKNFSKNSFP